MLDELAELTRASIGCVLGTAVGDAIGLPYEGLSKTRLAKMYPDLGEHHFVFGTSIGKWTAFFIIRIYNIHTIS